MIANAGTISKPGICVSSGSVDVGVEVGIDVDIGVDTDVGIDVDVIVCVEVVGACGSGGSPGPDPVAILAVPRVILRYRTPLFRSDAEIRCSITAKSVPALALNSSTSPSLISSGNGAGFT